VWLCSLTNWVIFRGGATCNKFKLFKLCLKWRFGPKRVEWVIGKPVWKKNSANSFCCYYWCQNYRCLKGWFIQKWKSFTQPHVIPNLYDWFSCVFYLFSSYSESSWDPMLFGPQCFSEYLSCSTAESHTGWWVNGDRNDFWLKYLFNKLQWFFLFFIFFYTQQQKITVLLTIHLPKHSMF